METVLAGSGLTLAELHNVMFGSSKAAKAFKSLVNMSAGAWDDTKAESLIPLAAKVIEAMASSQEFKTEYGATDNPSIFWNDYENPKKFIERNWFLFDSVKKWMNEKLGKSVPKLSSEVKKFLKEWVNTNKGSLPYVRRPYIEELKHFRPASPRMYYRGIRFDDVGELVSFTNEYSDGKPFYFESDRASSWSKDREIAERFGRYNAAANHNQAMMGWLNRVKNGKDYDGKGGFLIGARILPEQCLVDFNAPGLPFSGGVHGDEGEIILLPGVKIVTKVYDIFGDVHAEVNKIMSSSYNKRKTPIEPEFFNWAHVDPVSISGDDRSGTVKLKAPGGTMDEDTRKSIDKLFSKNLYKSMWLGNDTVRYQAMDLPQKVASRFLGRVI